MSSTPQPNETIHPLAVSTWDDEENQALLEVLASGRTTMGPKVAAFEAECAAWFGSRHAVMVNSGSSANLAAVFAMLYWSGAKFQPGDEVIVPAVSWSTTYAPVHQAGLTLRFVDIDADSLNLNLEQVEKAIGPRTRAVFAVNLLGAPNDFPRLRALCAAHDLVLMEDNCESMGATLDGRFTGTFGACGTLSTFFSHHICTMEGGIVLCDDDELDQVLRCLRAHGWLRDLPAENHVCNKLGDPFNDSFRFALPGFNLRPLELEAAVGSVQLRKLSGFLEARRRNAQIFLDLFADCPTVRLQSSPGKSSWFGFSIVLEGSLAGRRDEVVAGLDRLGVACRPIVAGNFTRNPVLEHLRHVPLGPLPVADRIHDDGFFVGNHHFDARPGLERLRSLIHDLS